MSKLTQGHIDCLVNWMKQNRGKRLNVTKTWRNNGYEVLSSRLTIAKKKTFEILEAEGIQVDKEKSCIPASRKISIEDIKEATINEEVIPEYKVEQIEGPIPLKYSVIVTPENIQRIGKSLQGAIYTANLMEKKAKITATINFE